MSKSLSQSRLRSMNPENCSVDELEKLKKSSFWFNEKKCTDEFIDSLKIDLLNKLNRTLVFNDVLQRKIQPLRLLQQFLQIRPDDILLHNIEEVEEVFQWAPHENVQSLFDPIHYEVFVNKKAVVVTPNSTIETLFDLQNILISSCFTLTAFSVSDIISNLEIFLDCTLTEFFVFREKIIFLFEWKEARECVLLVSFTIPPLLVEMMEEEEYLQFERNALFELTLQEDNNTKEKLGLVREKVRSISLSYHYHGFAKK